MTVDMASGNTMVDAIINRKMLEMQKNEISVEAMINVPILTEIDEIDLSRLLNYLLDNAIEECIRVPNEWHIELSVIILKKHLYVMLATMSEVKRKNISRRFGPIIWGKSVINILRIDSIIKKYGGFINHHTEGKSHVTEILVPVIGVK